MYILCRSIFVCYYQKKQDLYGNNSVKEEKTTNTHSLTHAHRRTRTHTRTQTQIHTDGFPLCISALDCLNVYVFMSLCVSARVGVCKILKLSYTRIHMHTQTHTHTHTHTQTHTRAQTQTHFPGEYCIA